MKLCQGILEADLSLFGTGVFHGFFLLFPDLIHSIQEDIDFLSRGVFQYMIGYRTIVGVAYFSQIL